MPSNIGGTVLGSVLSLCSQVNFVTADVDLVRGGVFLCGWLALGETVSGPVGVTLAIVVGSPTG